VEEEESRFCKRPIGEEWPFAASRTPSSHGVQPSLEGYQQREQQSVVDTCPNCGAEIDPSARFCETCGKPLARDGLSRVREGEAPAEPCDAAYSPHSATARQEPRPPGVAHGYLAAEVLLEVETHRAHVRGSVCQFRVRATRAAEAGCDVTVRLLLHGRGKYVEQDQGELEQHCRLGRRSEQLVLSFPFRPGAPGELPVETLRMVVSPAGKPEEGVAFECPDRSLFVRIDEEGRREGATVRIEGGIHVEAYGADVTKLVSLGRDDEAASAPECGWEPLALRPAGPERRTACTFGRCGRPVAVDLGLACSRCRKMVCRKHEDESMPGHCKLCAEAVRQKAFDQHAREVDAASQPEELVSAINRVTQGRPAFLGRIWTDRSNRPTTRDIATVPRTSHDWFRVGERFTLNVQADRDCYLTLIDLGTSGNVFMLLQNYPLRAGPPVSLSGPDESREWVVDPPPGIERLKAFFTLQPLSLFPGVGSFTSLGSARQSGDVVAKIRRAGVSLQEMPPNAWNDATCEFVVRQD
jgi:hypothetical protein